VPPSGCSTWTAYGLGEGSRRRVGPNVASPLCGGRGTRTHKPFRATVFKSKKVLTSVFDHARAQPTQAVNTLLSFDSDRVETRSASEKDVKRMSISTARTLAYLRGGRVFLCVSVGIVGHLAAPRAPPFVSRRVCKLETDPADRSHGKSLVKTAGASYTSHVRRHARQGRLRRPLRGVNPLSALRPCDRQLGGSKLPLTPLRSPTAPFEGRNRGHSEPQDPHPYLCW
jgi:hypothetical protein